MSVFVDCSVWFAAANSKDRNNAAAKQLLSGLSNPVTTDHVLVESWLVIQRHIHRRAAESYWELIRAGIAVVEKVEFVDLDTAWAMVGSFRIRTFPSSIARALRSWYDCG